MAKHCTVQVDGVVTLATPKQGGDDYMNAPDFVVAPHRHPATIASNQQDSPTRVHLNLEDLKCFEVVDRQFQSWGVMFRNCIAIRPSNPAFPARGSNVLMAGPKTGWLEATFTHPVSLISTFITSSQRLVLAAYNRDNQVVAQAEITEPNLAGSNSSIPPNTQLVLEAPNIHRLTFHAFDGQFTVDGLSFMV